MNKCFKIESSWNYFDSEQVYRALANKWFGEWIVSEIPDISPIIEELKKLQNDFLASSYDAHPFEIRLRRILDAHDQLLNT